MHVAPHMCAFFCQVFPVTSAIELAPGDLYFAITVPFIFEILDWASILDRGLIVFQGRLYARILRLITAIITENWYVYFVVVNEIHISFKWMGAIWLLNFCLEACEDEDFFGALSGVDLRRLVERRELGRFELIFGLQNMEKKFILRAFYTLWDRF